jgi:hypothetical protein
MTEPNDDLDEVTATPVNARWIWSMLLFLMLCLLLASLCGILWPET